MKNADTHIAARAGRGAAWVFGSTWLMALLRMGLFVVLARILEPADFGLFAATTGVLGLLEVITVTGVAPALIQHKALTRRHVSTALTASLLLGLLCSGAVWLGAGAAARVMRIDALAEILRTVAPVFFIRFASAVGSGLASREMRFALMAKADLAGFAAGTGLCTLLLAGAGFGAWSLILGYVTQHAVTTLVLLTSCGRGLSLGLHRRELAELARFGSGVSFANVANHFAQQGDYYVVGRVLGVQSLGLYNRAYNLMQLPVTTVVNTLDRVLFPALARMQDEVEKLRHVLRLSSSLVLILYLPLSVVLVVCAQDIVVALLGPKWTDMTATFRLLCCGLVFRAGYKTASTLLKVRGKAFVFAATQAAYALAVLGGAALGSSHGIAGVAAGVICALGLNCALLNLLGFREIGQPMDFLVRDFVAALGFGAGAGMAAWGGLRLGALLGLEAPLRLVVTGAVLLAAATALLWSGLCRRMLRGEVREFLQEHAARFSGARSALFQRIGFFRPQAGHA